MCIWFSKGDLYEQIKSSEYELSIYNKLLSSTELLNSAPFLITFINLSFQAFMKLRDVIIAL